MGTMARVVGGKEVNRASLEAAEAAGYAHPKDASHDNRHSSTLARYNAKQFERAAKIVRKVNAGEIVYKPSEDPELGPYVATLLLLEAKRSVILTDEREGVDERGKPRRFRDKVIVEDADNMAIARGISMMTTFTGHNNQVERKAEAASATAAVQVNIGNGNGKGGNGSGGDGGLYVSILSQSGDDDEALMENYQRLVQQVASGRVPVQAAVQPMAAAAALPVPAEEDVDDVMDGEFEEDPFAEDASFEEPRP